MLVKRVTRLMAGLLGFFGAETREEHGQTQKSISQREELRSILDLPDLIPVPTDCLITGTHFHVMLGEESTHWYGSSSIPGPIYNTIFSTHKDAHKFFVGYINQSLPGFISDEEIEESFEELTNIVMNSDDGDHSIKTSEGIYFQELDIRLEVCSKCLPVQSN